MSVSPDPAAAVVLAGGSGTRLGRGDGRNKVYLPLGPIPLLAWSLRTLDAHPAVKRLVLVIRAQDRDEAHRAIRSAHLSLTPSVVVGGATRSASEMASIEEIRGEILSGGVQTVLVHDGARPFINHPLIDRLLRAAQVSGAAIPGLRPEAQLVRVGDDGQLQAVPVDDLRRVQTPQAFSASTLLAAMDLARAGGYQGHDTAELVTRAGGPAARVMRGEPDNMKLTTPEDIRRAEALAARLGPPSG